MTTMSSCFLQNVVLLSDYVICNVNLYDGRVVTFKKTTNQDTLEKRGTRNVRCDLPSAYEWRKNKDKPHGCGRVD